MTLMYDFYEKKKKKNDDIEKTILMALGYGFTAQIDTQEKINKTKNILFLQGNH